jgi:hypothetical protein
MTNLSSAAYYGLSGPWAERPVAMNWIGFLRTVQSDLLRTLGVLLVVAIL